MATYTIRIVDKGEYPKETESNHFEPVIWGQFELVGEGYADKVEIKKADFTFPKAKELILEKVKKFLNGKFNPIEYQVEI